MTRGVRKDTGKSANWKGGKTVTSHGYVLVWVGKDHPLADVRGYAYEHRLVAAQQEGRVLDSKEHVHHKDEDHANNQPDNLEVKASLAEHKLAHRAPDSKLRLPGEANELLKCACGCGGELLKYDPQGRPREYLSGHNPMPAPTVDAVLGALASGPLQRTEIVARTGLTTHAVAVALSRLKRRGLVANVSHGCWSKTE